METLIIQSDTAKIKVLKAFLKEFEIAFGVTKESQYDPKFEAKIKQSDKDLKAGKYQVIETSDLWK